ncbi:MAG: TIGR03790 family protein [Planctomycetaceae bacterium]|nr:MAG: TIGR03790 family protein [Planctomycetaceae bacterium]
MHSPFVTAFRSALCCLCLIPIALARAELRPEEVGVIASGQGRQSSELARHYMKARGIPDENLFVLEAPSGEVLARQAWDLKVRPSIRKWLGQNDRYQKIRCLVTLWDVPLKIGNANLKTPGGLELTTFLTSEKAARRADIARLANRFEMIANDNPGEPIALPDDADASQLANLLDAPFQAALARFRQLEAAGGDPVSLKKSRRSLDSLYLAGTGLAGSLRVLEAQMKQNPKGPGEIKQAIDVRRGELNGLRVGINHLSTLPESPARDMELMVSLQQSDGLLGAFAWSSQQLDLLAKNETHASFDSELALVLWPDHALLRWLPNLRHHQQRQPEPNVRPKVMMVSRIDGPTFEICRQLVDTAITVEKQGLKGKVYIDARGTRPSREPGSYGDYDQSLRELADLLRAKTKLEVILDAKEGLFQPGDCPDAALYCGWYSLSNYIDAFTWRPGAVGYHMASGEASTLRNPKSNVWCKRMLESGVCATLGPTFEPYLAAFPRPNEFFPLLLTGKLTLAEVYAATCPFQSWVMTLVGDPLYNPYKSDPQLAPEDLPESLRLLLAE